MEQKPKTSQAFVYTGPLTQLRLLGHPPSSSPLVSLEISRDEFCFQSTSPLNFLAYQWRKSTFLASPSPQPSHVLPTLVEIMATSNFLFLIDPCRCRTGFALCIPHSFHSASSCFPKRSCSEQQPATMTTLIRHWMLAREDLLRL